MAISDKLEYLNDTKQLLKDKINNLGGSIDDNTTFRQYAEQLQNVYDNLPKTEYREGTEITLSNTLKGKLDYDDGKVGFGQSSQDSTQGYNLLDLKDGTYIASGVTVVVVNGKATISGTSTSLVTVPIDLNNSLSLTNNQVYSLYANNESINADVAFRPIAGDGVFQTSFSSLNNASAVTFTGSTTSITKVHIRVASGVTVNNIICKPMVVMGNDTTKSYEKYTGGQASPNPSYPQNINSVTGNQDVVVSGKNKFNGEFRQGNQDQTGVSVRIFSKDNNWKLEVGKTYTISTNIDTSVFKYALYIAQYPYLSVSPLNTILYHSGYKTTGSFTFACENDGYFGFTVARRSETDIVPSDMENIWFQVEENNQATPYEPYITPTSYQLSLGDIELNAIGDYKDELIYNVDEDKVYKNEKIGKYTFTGNENITLATSVGNMYAFRYDDLSNNYIGRDENQYLCTNYKQKLVADWDNEGIINVSTSVPYIYIFTTGDTASNVTAFKTWLANNKPILYYRLAESTLTELTDQTLKAQVKALYNAHSNNGTTIITSNGNLPMIIKVRGLKGE